MAQESPPVELTEQEKLELQAQMLVEVLAPLVGSVLEVAESVRELLREQRRIASAEFRKTDPAFLSERSSES